MSQLRHVRGRHSDARVGDPGCGTSSAFADYDMDGDLDLCVANYIRWSPEIESRCYSAGNLRDYCHPKSSTSPTT